MTSFPTLKIKYLNFLENRLVPKVPRKKQQKGNQQKNENPQKRNLLKKAKGNGKRLNGKKVSQSKPCLLTLYS